MVQLLVSKYLMCDGQYATATAYGLLFLFAKDVIVSRTSRLVDTKASDDMLAESNFFGSARLSFGLMYQRIDISAKVYARATGRATIAIILVL